MIGIGRASIVTSGQRLQANLDLAEIAYSIGEVGYRWHLATDAIAWSDNAQDVLQVGDIAAIASGRGYAKLIEAGASNSREAAILNSALRDSGNGIGYQVRYAIRTSEAQNPLWVEDSGRWFAGPDGRPAFAHGMIRLVCDGGSAAPPISGCSRLDDLTGELGAAA